MINVITIRKTPVKNKLFSNSLLCFLILVHYTNMKDKNVSCINRHLRINNWFKLQRKKSSIVIRKSFLNKIDNDGCLPLEFPLLNICKEIIYHIPDTCLQFARVSLLGPFLA